MPHPGRAVAQGERVEEVAGYRVLRSAGHGDRARLLLGFDDGSTVVLKIVPALDPARRIEIEALSRAAGDHVVRLDDVAIDGRDAVLVLERLSGGTLAELLDRRGMLEAGEAVTILAPLATTIDRIHTAGVAHGALSVSAICFRDDGAPALTGFGRAELFAPGSPEVVRETVPGVIADRDALRALATIVLGRVAGERAGAAARLAAELGDATPDALARTLFDLAAPAVVRFDAEPSEAGGIRVGGLHEPADVEAETAPGLPPWLLALVPDGVRERVADPLDRLRALWSGWSVRRRRLALGVVAGGLTVLGVVAFVPAGPPAAGQVSPPSAVPTSEATSESPGLPDDPVAAATVLLQLRERCLRDLSLLCLDGVAQAGSAAYAADAVLIRSIQNGGEYGEEAILEGDPVLVERLGDSALLDLPPGSEPASLLLLRTTNGWRIRQYLTSGYLDAPAG